MTRTDLRPSGGLPPVFGVYRGGIETEIRNVIGFAPPGLAAIIAYHLGWVDEHGAARHHLLGKLVRPTLCLATCRAAGGNTDTAMPAAAALELIHNFSLIHDDIEDGSHERHHQPTVWRLWGEAQAINAGDMVTALTQLALLRLEENRIGYYKIVQAVRMVARACITLCEGQQMDITYEDRLDIGVDQYLEMIFKKTGVLFSTSMRLGALIGCDNEDLWRQMDSIGSELGLAYQMRDDLLGVWGRPEITGKPVGGDIEKRKKSLPVMIGLQEASGPDRLELLRLFQQSDEMSPADVERAVTILDRSGAKTRSQAMIDERYGRAMAMLTAANLPADRCRELREVAEFLAARMY